MAEEYIIGLLGDPGCGKTTLTLRGMNNTINNGRFRSQSVIDNRSFVFQVLDYNTPQEYKLLRENYIKTSHGVMIIYAVNNRQSYDAVTAYIDYVRQVNSAAAIILIANKNDLENYRVVSEQDSRDQATIHGLRLLSISATNDSAETVKHCYDTLIREIVRKRALNKNANPPKNIQDFTNKPTRDSPRRKTENNRANAPAVANGNDPQDQEAEDRPAGRIRANATTTNQKNMKRTKSFFSLRFITTLFKDDKKKTVEENQNTANSNHNNDNNASQQRETKSEEEKKNGGNEKDYPACRCQVDTSYSLNWYLRLYQDFRGVSRLINFQRKSNGTEL